jgi:hypothetical protein
MTVTHEDPFADYQAPAQADAVKLESPGDFIVLTVTEVGQPFEAEYGNVFVISGVVENFGGKTVESPAKGADAGYLIAYDKLDKKSGEMKPAHVAEETYRAIKAAGRRSGSIEVGDTIAWKREEDVTHGKDGKKFANPFRRHIVRVLSLADTGPSVEQPF